jgi:multidrug resistance efflux pump
MANLKNLDEMQLNEELDRASEHLSKAESAYVQAQNMCSEIEIELDRRDTLKKRAIPQEGLHALIDKWEVKASDMHRAAEAFKDDLKLQHSLHMQRDLIRSCISDLRSLMGY